MIQLAAFIVGKVDTGDMQARACACVRACTHACIYMCLCVHVCACMCMRARSLAGCCAEDQATHIDSIPKTAHAEEPR